MSANDAQNSIYIFLSRTNICARLGTLSNYEYVRYEYMYFKSVFNEINVLNGTGVQLAQAANVS